MSKAILGYLLTFLLGGLTAYFILSNADKATVFHPKSSSISCPSSNSTAVIPARPESLKVKKDADDNQPTLCQKQTIHLEQQLTETQQLNEQLTQAMKSKISEISMENAVLKHKLAAFEPSNIDDEELKKHIPKPYDKLVSNLPTNIKQEIFDFHQQEQDLDWGYIKQQQLTDFITTHVNFEYIELTSISCKFHQCEVILDEKINEDSMRKQGLSEEKINVIKETEQPKYKKIFDDLRINPELNLRTGAYMPNRFGIYMQLKDKS